MLGQKHLIECHCVLPLYKKKKDIFYHKFPVYSSFDENGSIIPKYVKCNNCDVIHYVFEICKSEIKVDGESIGSILSIDDVKVSLNDKIINILENYQCDITVYETVLDVINNNCFPFNVILKRDIINEEYHVKILKIEKAEKFSIISDKIGSKVMI